MTTRIARRIAVLVPAIALVAFLLAYAYCKVDWYGGSTKTGMAKGQLLDLGKAVKLIASEEKFTGGDWDKISGMSDIAPLITPRMELGEQALSDPWGQPFVQERRDRGNDIVLKIRTGRQLPGKWCDFCDFGELGTEIVVSRANGQVTQVNRLWSD